MHSMTKLCTPLNRENRVARSVRFFAHSIAIGFLVAAAVSGCGGGGGDGSPVAVLPPVVTDKFPLIPTPTVSGPIASESFSSPTKNYQFYASDVALASNGYIEEEFYIEGKANAYDAPTSPPAIPPSANATIVTPDVPYKTRMIVRRPSDPAKFNGTVIVEWFNVSDNFDGEYFWAYTKSHILRSGYAYVGVSAQNNSIAHATMGLKAFSPTRYGSLDVNRGGTITGDALSYDIYSQAAKAALSVPSVLKGLPVKNVMGVGFSQSAMRIGLYVNYVHMRAPIFDSFIIHANNPAIRDDLPTPLIKVLSETEASMGTANAKNPQADTAKRRTWWVAGTSHGDATQRMGRNAVRARDLGPALTPDDSSCAAPTVFYTRTHVPFRHVLNAAVAALKTQVETGALPPVSPKFETDTDAAGVVSLRRDSFGNALGAIRLAQMAVPVARSSGAGCGMNGIWEPFTTSVLQTLYPSNADYVNKIANALNASVASGFVLPEEAPETLAEAKASVIGMNLVCGPLCLNVHHFTATTSSTGLLRERTVYYNTPAGDNLIQVVDEAHLAVARGYSQLAGSDPAHYYFNMGIAALERYIALVVQAQLDNRMTVTAANSLINEATNIIRGLQVL